MRRLAVIGLDSVPPALVFERWRDRLPTLTGLARHGAWGRLRSCHPPITIPAWSTMLTGRDPGELGLYGFRNRRSHRYGDQQIATSLSVRAPRLWQMLAPMGARSILVGVPQTYPPPAINGCVVSCFLTPTGAEVTTHPRELGAEIERLLQDDPTTVPGARAYLFDVDGFRGADRAELLTRIQRKTRQDFALARHLLGTRPWEFFMMVVMGTDRIQHAFWPRTDDDPAWEILREYYELVDAEVARLLECIGKEAATMVVSDHGAKTMEGGVFLNEWLIAGGWLTLKQRPPQMMPLQPEMIDWSRTLAWSDGGYCGRIYLNVRGRETEGRVSPNDTERLREELAEAISAMVGPDGVDLRSVAHRPEDLYAQVNGIAPDLIVYLGDLGWRVLGSVGAESLYSNGNDTGPDGANHDWDGIFILDDPNEAYGGVELHRLQLTDIVPMALKFYDLKPSSPQAPKP